MSYYFAKTLADRNFDGAVARVTDALKQEGFGVLTTIDVRDTLKNKIGVEFRRYRILGACNPPLAHEALKAEEQIGLMLPCNVVVQERDDGAIVVSAIDPAVAMQPIGNPRLAEVAAQVRDRLSRVVDAL